MKDTPAKMKEAFLLAAEQFLECEQPNKAVICLQNSRERELVAHLYEKMNQVVNTRLNLYLLQNAPWSLWDFSGWKFFLQLEKAGETYRKLKRPIEGSRCYEQLGKFNLAVETLVENDQYEMAIDTLKRYKSLRKVSDI